MGVLIVLGLFFIIMSLNVPLAFALGAAMVVVGIPTGMIDPNIVFQTYFSAHDSFTLIAIPFFILAGNIMLTGGISIRLINSAKALIGNVRGSLAMVTVVACMIFAAISGSAPATTAAIGALMIPALVKDGYNDGFAASLTACSGAMGPIIPPSILFILYGSLATLSVSDLFLAGIIPGIMMGVILCIFSYFIARKYKFGTEREVLPWKEKFKILWYAKWSLLIPVIILGGIYGGIFTPTEAAVVACDYGLIIGIFVYKELKLKDIPRIFAESASTTGYCLIIMGAAQSFAKMIALEQVPILLGNLLSNFVSTATMSLLVIMVVMIVVGFFMEPIPALVILTPLFLPIVKMFGVDLLHFGVIMVMSTSLGMCTPPVGVNLYVAAGTAKIPMDRMFKWLPLCVGALALALLLTVLIPSLSTFLPNLL